MDKAAIYRKTPKGMAEIASTDRTLERRLRPLLILVDGHLTGNRIHALAAGIGIEEADFDQLISSGYIETMPLPGPRTLRGDEGDVARAREAAAWHRRTPLERFSDGQRYLCETAADKLGLTSFLFVLKLEKCSNAEELLALLPDFEAALGRKLDKSYARHCCRIAETILNE